MNKILKWFVGALISFLILVGTFLYMNMKTLNVCNPGVISISIFESTYPNLKGQICNVSEAGMYTLTLHPTVLKEGDVVLHDLGQHNLSAGNHYFEMAVNGDNAWASPKTGEYEVHLYGSDKSTLLAVSDRFNFVNDNKVKIIDFVVAPENPKMGQSVTFTWSAENASKCIIDNVTNEPIQLVAEGAGSGSHSEVISKSTYYQLICFGQDGRKEDQQLKGDFDREYKGVFLAQ